MAARPNLGYAAAMGVEGGFEALHKIIAARQQQEEHAQLQRLRDEAAVLAERRLQEDTAFRQTQQQQQVLDREEQRKYQQDVLSQGKAREERMLANTEIDNDRAAFDNTPGGTVVDEATYQRAVRAGYGPQFTRLPGEHPLAPAQYEFKGGANWQKGEADRVSREEQRERDRQLQIDLARERSSNAQTLAQITQANKEAGGWQKVEDPNSPSGMSWVSPYSNERRPVAGDTPVGPPGARNAKGADEMVRFISALDALEKVGDAHGWVGLGLPGAFDSKMQQWGLAQPAPQEIAVRAALGDVRSFIAHERYGAALTEGEKAILDTFVANIQTQGQVTKEMVRAVREVQLNVMEDVLSGHRAVYNKHRPDAGTPTVTGVRPYVRPGGTAAPPTGPTGDAGITIKGIISPR